MFLSANLQERRFRDFHQVESQNWFMGTGVRRLGTGRLSVAGMISLEPFTLRDLGSAQAFQTGETLGGAPLIDYQHPHDLLMHASLTYAHPLPRGRARVTAALVGEPALGPTTFMHRPSASPNPTVPLTHHQLDSTHVTPGVVTVGWDAARGSIEASVFRGREPDENRLDLDLGALDSWSARALLRRGSLAVQASGARLRRPDPIEPGDVTRLTASVEWAGRRLWRLSSITLAWGMNLESASREGGWLAEAAAPAGSRGTLFVRGEIVDKHILEAGGAHPPGFTHPHVLSRVAAWTTGYQWRLADGGAGRVDLGADVTVHRTPSNLVESYGHPVSIHLFLRWGHGENRTRRATAS